MAKHTIVSIYQVDSAGVTGAYIGEGSLVDPRFVLLDPLLSDAIAAGVGPTCLRVGICSGTPDGSLVEVIDGWGQPRVLGKSESGDSLVGLELRSAAISPIDVLDGLSEAQTEDELVDRAVRALEPILTDRPDPVPFPAPWCKLPGLEYILCRKK